MPEPGAVGLKPGRCMAAALLMMGLATLAAAQPANGTGWGMADPQQAARRPAMADVEPVFRGPTVDTLATIRKRGILRVGVAISEPMAMHDAKGALVGYSIDLARRLADDLGVQVEFVETSWSGVIPDLLDRQFDLIAAGLWVTAPRALVINFTQPSASEGIYLISNKASAGLQSAADFNRPGMKIAVYAGTPQERLAARLFPQASLVKVEGDGDQLAPVLEGKAQAALVPTFAPQVFVRSAPDKLALPLDKPLSTTSAALGIRKGDADFLAYLNTWLMMQRDEGWLDERAAYWAAWSD
jgi:polar amino acid transport system substrate-binding protein